MLGKRCRRWTSNTPALGQRLVIAGLLLIYTGVLTTEETQEI